MDHFFFRRMSQIYIINTIFRIEPNKTLSIHSLKLPNWTHIGTRLHSIEERQTRWLILYELINTYCLTNDIQPTPPWGFSLYHVAMSSSLDDSHTKKKNKVQTTEEKGEKEIEPAQKALPFCISQIKRIFFLLTFSLRYATTSDMIDEGGGEILPV